MCLLPGWWNRKGLSTLVRIKGSRSIKARASLFVGGQHFVGWFFEFDIMIILGRRSKTVKGSTQQFSCVVLWTIIFTITQLISFTFWNKMLLTKYILQVQFKHSQELKYSCQNWTVENNVSVCRFLEVQHLKLGLLLACLLYSKFNTLHRGKYLFQFTFPVRVYP